MASEFDQAFLTPEQVVKIDEYKKMYAEGQATGNQTMMDAAHAGAEAVRATANYSGNTDGSGYIPFSAPSANTSDTYNSTYNNDANGYIEEMYRQKQEAQEAALNSAYKQNVNTLNATKEKIPGQYQEARNATAGQAAVQRSGFNEYAASSGLNSGAGGQAQLAFGNTLQGNLSGLDNAQASALAELDLQMANLETNYRNAVQQAIAQGEFEKAQALYQEFQNQRSLAMQQAQFDKTMGYNYETLDASKDDTAYNRTFAAAQATGVFDGMAAFGWSSDLIAAAETAYAATNTTTTSSDRFSSYSPTTSYSSPFYEATGSYRYGNIGTLFTTSEYNTFTVNVGMNRTKNGQRATIEDAYKEGKITKKQAEALLDHFGIPH